MNKIWTIMFTVIVLMSSFALAEEFTVITYSTNFLVSTDAQLCSCGNGQIPISVTNQGDVPTSYIINSLDSSVTLSSAAFVLAPNQQYIAYATVPLTCGDYGQQDSFRVLIRDSFNQEQIIEVIPETRDCLVTSFALDAAQKNVSACEAVTSTLYITNDGQVYEDYIIRTNPATTSLSAGSVGIPPQVTAEINATYNFACGTTGTETLEYEIEALNKGLTYEVEQEIIFDDEFDFRLSATTDTLSLCAAQQDSASFKIEHIQAFANQYAITLQAPDFILADIPSTVWLDATNSTFEFSVQVAPDANVQGTFPVTVQVASLYGDQQAISTVNVTVNDCYNVDIAAYVPETKYVCEQDTFTETITLINTGTEDVTVDLVSYGSESIFLDTQTITVAQDESVDVLLFYVENATTLPAEETVGIEAYYQGRLVASKSFDLVTDTLDTCYAISVPGNNQKNVHYTVEEVSVTVQNTGTRYGEYHVLSDDATNTFFPLNSTIDLGRTEKSSLTFARLANVSPGEEYVFNVSFIHADSSAVFTEELTFAIKDDPLLVRAWDSCAEFIDATPPCQLASLALIIFIAVFAALLIFRSYRKRYYLFPWKLFIIGLILLVVAFMSVYTFIGAPELYTQHTLPEFSTTNLVLVEDEAQTYQLTDFFFDPDGDIELYGVSEINEEFLSYRLVNSSLTIIPAEDWNGMTMLRLYAVDSQGAVAESQVIRVDVLPVEDYSFWGMYAMLCMWVNLLLLLILFILIIGYYSYRRITPEYLEAKEKARKEHEKALLKAEKKAAKEAEAREKKIEKESVEKEQKSESDEKKSKKKLFKKSSSKPKKRTYY